MKRRILTTQELIRRPFVACRFCFETSVIADRVLQRASGPKRLCVVVQAPLESAPDRVRHSLVRVRVYTACLRKAFACCRSAVKDGPRSHPPPPIFFVAAPTRPRRSKTGAAAERMGFLRSAAEKLDEGKGMVSPYGEVGNESSLMCKRLMTHRRI